MKPSHYLLRHVSLGLGTLVLFALASSGCSSPDSSSAEAGDEQNVTTARPIDIASLDKLVTSLKGAASDDARSTLVRAFMRDVAYSQGGFPIREKGKVAFAFFDPDRHPGMMSVAGDFNGFNGTGAPMTTPVAGFPFYVRVQPLEDAAARSRYKLVRDGRDFFADPQARRFVYDEGGEISLLEAGDDAGHLERWPDFDDKLGSLAARTITAYVPPHYVSAGKATFPLLVMQDGQNLFNPTASHGGWRVAESAERAILGGQIRPLVIVGIPTGAARFDEYTHVQDKIELGTIGGKAPEYADFVAKGVVPFMRSRYRLGSTPATTGVLGSSLGGLVSFFIAKQHPEMFGFAGSMSGTMGWGSAGLKNKTMIDIYRTGAPAGLSLYLDSGGGDGGSCAQGLGSDNFCSNLEMRTVLTAGGRSEGKTLHYRHAPGAEHNEAEWAKRLPGALHDWFPGAP